MRFFRICRRHGQPLQYSVLVDQLDETEITEPTDHQLRDVRARLLRIERSGENRANLREERLPMLDSLVIRDITQNDGEQPCPLDVQLRDGCIRGKLLAIFAQAQDPGSAF